MDHPDTTLATTSRGLLTFALVSAVVGVLFFPRFLPQAGAKEGGFVQTDMKQMVAAYHSFVDHRDAGEKEDDLPLVAPLAGEEVYLMGARYAWKPALRLEAGQTYHLRLFSTDTLHGFNLPGARLRLEAIPGYVTHYTFTAPPPGRYPVLCDEFCGAGHHVMAGLIVVTGGAGNNVSPAGAP